MTFAIFLRDMNAQTKWLATVSTTVTTTYVHVQAETRSLSVSKKLRNVIEKKVLLSD